jgi:hypothetical protein
VRAIEQHAHRLLAPFLPVHAQQLRPFPACWLIHVHWRIDGRWRHCKFRLACSQKTGSPSVQSFDAGACCVTVRTMQCTWCCRAGMSTRTRPECTLGGIAAQSRRCSLSWSVHAIKPLTYGLRCSHRTSPGPRLLHVAAVHIPRHGQEGLDVVARVLQRRYHCLPYVCSCACFFACTKHSPICKLGTSQSDGGAEREQCRLPEVQLPR